MTDNILLPVAPPTRSADDFELHPAMAAPVGAANTQPTISSTDTSPSTISVERTGHVRSTSYQTSPRRGRGSNRGSTPSPATSPLSARRDVGTSRNPSRSEAGDHSPLTQQTAQNGRRVIVDIRPGRRSSGSSSAGAMERHRGRGGLSLRGGHSATSPTAATTPLRTNNRSSTNPTQAAPADTPVDASAFTFEPVRWGNANFQFGANLVPAVPAVPRGASGTSRRVARMCTRRGASSSTPRSSIVRAVTSATFTLPVRQPVQPPVATVPPAADPPQLPTARRTLTLTRRAGQLAQLSAASVPPADPPQSSTAQPTSSGTVAPPTEKPPQPSAAVIHSVDLLHPQTNIPQLAEDASILLELISKTDPEGINSDHWQIIDSVFSNVLKIRAGLRAGRARDDGGAEGVEAAAVDSSCIICYTQVADAVLMPCKHLVLCVACYGKMKTEQAVNGVVHCPICRSGVTYTIAIFRG